MDLLETEENSNFNYSCEGEGCYNKYSAKNAAKEKVMNLSKGESKLIGLRIKGLINSIQSVNFTLNSNAGESCENQIEINIFDDNKTEIMNDKISNSDCVVSETMGCIEEIKSIDEGELVNIDLSEKVCQRMTLPIAPGFKVGAWIKKINSSTKDNVSMEIYSQGSIIGECKIKYDQITDEGRYGCVINYSTTTPKEVYVCASVLGNSGGQKSYETQGILGSEKVCGFLGSPIKEEVGAYRIFAIGKQFGTPGDIHILNPRLENRIKLSDLVLNYLTKKYGTTDSGDVNCSNECIIPLKIKSKTNQTITLKDLSFLYSRIGAGRQIEDNFYDLVLADARLSSEFQKLFLNEINFTLPEKKGKFDYTITLGNKELFSTELLISNTSSIKALYPTKVPVLYLVEYSVDIENPERVVKYLWTINNQTRETNINQINYTFTKEGIQNIKVSIEDESGIISSKIFEISVESFTKTINKTINKNLENIKNIQNRLNSLTGFEKEVIENHLKLEELLSNISSIQKDFLISSDMSQGQKEKILSDLLKLSVPISINKIKQTNNLLFYPKKQKIQPLRIIEINNEDENLSSDIEDTILEWHQENIDSKINQNSYLIIYNNKKEILNIFEVKLNKINNLDYTPYLFLSKLKEMYLQGESSWNVKNTYFYKDFEEDSTSVNFATTEDINFDEIPFFISPDLSVLKELINAKKVEEFEPEDETGKWIIYSIIIIFLIIASFVVYVFLYKWYEYNYENHLFKNRNDLYNLINYINLLRNNNVETKEIEKRLKKAGWNYEQRAYVIKKYLGKRTGMPKIPLIDRFISKTKPGKTDFKPGFFDKIFSKLYRKKQKKDFIMKNQNKQSRFIK